MYTYRLLWSARESSTPNAWGCKAVRRVGRARRRCRETASFTTHVFCALLRDKWCILVVVVVKYSGFILFSQQTNPQNRCNSKCTRRWSAVSMALSLHVLTRQRALSPAYDRLSHVPRHKAQGINVCVVLKYALHAYQSSASSKTLSPRPFHVIATPPVCKHQRLRRVR